MKWLGFFSPSLSPHLKRAVAKFDFGSQSKLELVCLFAFLGIILLHLAGTLTGMQRQIWLLVLKSFVSPLCFRPWHSPLHQYVVCGLNSNSWENILLSRKASGIKAHPTFTFPLYSGNPGPHDGRVVPGRSALFHASRRPGLGPLRFQGHLEPGGLRRQEAGRGGEGEGGGDEGEGGGRQGEGHGAAEDPPRAEARAQRAAAGPEAGAGLEEQRVPAEAEGARPQAEGATADQEVADAAEGKPQTGT